MKKTMVFYPGLAVSHFVPMMRLADELVEHGYAVAVALIDPAAQQHTGMGSAIAATVDRVISSSKPSISFHTLQRVPPPQLTESGADQNLLGYLDLVRRHAEPLHGFIRSMPPVVVVHALVVDSVSVEALDVAKRLQIPGYIFQPANAGAFSVFLHLSSIRAEQEAQGGRSFGELGDTPVELPGLPPMPASHLYSELLEDPDSEVYKAMMKLASWDAQANGVLVNTVESLEARAVSALRCYRDLQLQVYCVGPLVEKAAVDGEIPPPPRHECLAWLDLQPDRSVVFLCFGSLGVGNHSEEQLREIAVGLERSGHRFLWVVRAPAMSSGGGEPDLDALLPAGFSERTSGRGVVVKLWAPQVEVLHHRATGAFVTHCGWNSVLEGVSAGVPMLCWPLYSEQKMNKVVMVEMGIAVEMAGWRRGMVMAEEVEAKVRLVLGPDSGTIRARVTAHKEAAEMAWAHGGSSRAAVAQFLSDVEGLTRAP